MDLKLFFSTFLLIFLAELGDKTQLAALARTATAESGKWTVFAAAASALVLSTLIAVLVGTLLTRWLPEHVIRIGAALLFLLFGVLLLRDAIQRRAATAQSRTDVAMPGGLLARVVLRVAAEFEAAAAADYRQLAANASSPRMRDLFLTLAQAEESHWQRLRGAGSQHGHVILGVANVPSRTDPGLLHDVAIHADPVLQHAIEHETATAQFYAALANETPIPALKRIFMALSAEEYDHVGTLVAAMLPRQVEEPSAPPKVC